MIGEGNKVFDLARRLEYGTLLWDVDSQAAFITNLGILIYS